MNWRRTLAVAAMFAVAASGCSLGGDSAKAPPYPLVSAGSRVVAASVTGTTPQGQPVELTRLAGRAVIIDLEVPGDLAGPVQEAELTAAAQQTSSQSAWFLHVVEVPTALRVVRFVAQGHVISFPGQAQLDQTRAALSLGARGIALCLVVDRHGRIAARLVGLVDAPRLLATIKEVAAES